MTRETTAASARPLWRRIVSVGAVLLFAVGLLGDSVYCYRKAIATFDTVAYVSIANGGGNEYKRVGECAAALRGPHSGCDDVTASYMTHAVSSYSDADFATFLRFYQVKPLYAWLAAGIDRALNVGAYTALRILSAGSFFLTGVLLWVWLKEHLSVTAASLCALILISSSGVVDMGKNLLPDMLSTFLLLASAYLVLYRRPKWLGMAMLFLLPLARLDTILFTVIFAGTMIYIGQRSPQLRWRGLALLGAGCVVETALLVRLTHPLPWPVLFTRSFVAWIDPASFAMVHVRLAQYLHILADAGVRTVVYCLRSAIFFAAVAMGGNAGRLRALLAAGAAAVAVRIVAYPGAEERYYVWFFLIAAIAACVAVAKQAKGTGAWYAEIE